MMIAILIQNIIFHPLDLHRWHPFLVIPYIHLITV